MTKNIFIPEKKKSLNQKISSLIVWGGVILVALLLASTGFYYLFDGFKAEKKLSASINQSIQPPPPTMTNEPEPAAEVVIQSKEYTLEQLQSLFAFDTQPDWGKALLELSFNSDYIAFDPNLGWIVAITDDNQQKIKDIISKYLIPKVNAGFFISFNNLPNLDIYKKQQLLNRSKFLGYNASLKNPYRKSWSIEVGPFSSYNNAKIAGEKIYFYHKEANLFSANFKIYSVRQKKASLPNNKIIINLASADSLSTAKEILNKAQEGHKVPLIYINKVDAAIFEVNITDIDSINDAKTLLDQLKNDFNYATIIQTK